MELYERVDSVCDQRSFLEFVKALIADREDEVAKEREKPSPPYGLGANGWGNSTIEDFLEAATAWAEDSEFGQMQWTPEGMVKRLPEDNPWRRFANFLYAGKFYE